MNKKEESANKCPICGRPTHKESKYCIFHARPEEKTEEEFKQALKDYVEEIKTKHIKYNFEDFIFLGDIDFKEDFNITVFKNAVFSGATFKEIAYFNESTFKGDTGFAETIFEGDAIFRNATFKGDALFRRANFNGCAIFEEATFKGDAVFWNATFKGDPKFIKAVFEGFAFFNEAIFEKLAYFVKTTFESFAHFTGVTFQKGASFEKATFEDLFNFEGVFFEGGADFVEATFKKYTVFEKATFKEIVHFTKATFEDHFNFEKATFKKNVLFKETTFKEWTDFEGVFFERGANFNNAIFEQSAIFEGANLTGGIDFIGTTFEGGANFNNAIFSVGMFEGAIFKGCASFKEATFTEDAYFFGVTFEGDVDLRMKSLAKGVDLREIRVLSGSKLSLRVNNNIGIISFKRACLESAYLDIELEKSILIDFTDTLLKNTKIIKRQIEDHILQEKKKEFSTAQEIYLLLKNNFQSIGRYEDENWAFKREKDMERKCNCHFKTLHRWIWSCFLNGIFGYGIQPFKVIMSAILIITLFAFFFMTSGISNVGIEQITSNNFFDCIYFSTITFTTLGYGDFRPLEGLGRILAGSEAFIGAFMMALFVYTFARRTGGR